MFPLTAAISMKTTLESRRNSFQQEQLGSSTRPAKPPDSCNDVRSAKLRWFFRCLTVALGLTQIVLARNTVGPDARSYLEIARAILRHDWPMVPNAYWSVLYPWLLAPMLAILKPSLRWEFPVAHALAFPVLLLCIAALEFFWASVLRLKDSSANGSSGTSAIPSWQFWALGYSFFIWLVVGDLITAINPDLSMTTLALFSAGLLNRIAMAPNARRGLYVWFGLSLGLGYLVKAVLFPMGIVFLVTAAFVTRRCFPARKWHFASAALIFSLIALPEVALLSHVKHRPTFSDAGKLNFAWSNYHLPQRNWQGEPRGSGTPLHPTRKIFDHPAIYEFNGPVRSSYSPWYDPSYWNDGMSPVLQPRVVARHVLTEVAVLGEILRHPTAWIVGIVVILLGCNLRQTLMGIAGAWYLVSNRDDCLCPPLPDAGGKPLFGALGDSALGSAAGGRAAEAGNRALVWDCHCAGLARDDRCDCPSRVWRVDPWLS